jgi:predicted permease
METLWQDIRYAARMLLKNPGFTAVVVLTLALGIGANTALFSLVDALLLRQLPVTRPQELVAVGKPSRVNGLSMGTPQMDFFSYPLYRALRENNKSFSDLAASGRTGKLDRREEGTPAGSEPEHPNGRMVSGNYFSLLGVRAAIGRTISEEDDKTGATPVAVLSYDYWVRRFARDPGVLGRRLNINGSPFRVIGVAAPEFFGEVVGAKADLWFPAGQQPQVNPGRNWIQDPHTSWLLLMGRLAPGATQEQAGAEMDALAHRLVVGLANVKLDADVLDGIAKGHVPVNAGGPGFSALRDRASQPLLLLLGIVGVVLLVCCANIANLLLTRATARSREIGIRLAVGAGRIRLVRQLLTECFLLSLLGTALGAAVAVWCTGLLLRLASQGPDPIPLDVRLDLRVLGFTLGTAVLTTLLFGLAPAVRATRVDLLTALKPALGRSGPAGGRGGRFSAGKALVVAQVAVSLLLLTGAGLLVRSLRNLYTQDVGFDREHILLLEVDPVASGYTEKQMDAMYRDLTAALTELPGVKSAAPSYNGLFAGTDSATLLVIEGDTHTSRDDRIAFYDMVGPNYFDVVGARILVGRGIGPQDTETSPKVAVVGERMAHFYFPGQNPVGKHILLGDAAQRTPYEIVGVVRDIKERRLADEPERRFFLPLAQRTDAMDALRIQMRSSGDPQTVRNSVRALLASRYPNLQVEKIEAVSELMRQSITEARLLAQLSSFFGVLALLLSVTGLYGVMSYLTTQRTNEIGIRMALGARGGDVLRMVLGESMMLLGVGVAAGFLLSLGALRVLSSRLFGLSATDPATLVEATLVLAAAVVLAGFLPARRAARLDPLVALHYE